MNLTTEQINQIDTFLERNDVKYLDIKLELLDHIASQIEALISDQNSSFEEAFTIITTHWKPRFRSSSSFLIGVVYSFPKIVLDRLVARVKKYTLFLFCFGVLFCIPMVYYKDYGRLILAPFDGLFTTLTILLSMVFYFLLIKINIHSKSTSYRFLVNQSAPVIILIMFFNIVLDQEVIELKLFYTLLILFQATIAFQNYRLHTSFIKKLTKA
ncbi:hypothetical protein [Flavobacterium sp.]|jgi:hypothetical protein|uniref:hypothetical protein n=1 Tax=Flavobacterium sp. TaxID=239 RepID=UPI0022C3FFC5|nr:hypothetical protein [Flavobacterium sp.]MCZ8230013.1 hypothetical protein [Flavobacterium sp.]